MSWYRLGSCLQEASRYSSHWLSATSTCPFCWETVLHLMHQYYLLNHASGTFVLADCFTTPSQLPDQSLRQQVPAVEPSSSRRFVLPVIRVAVGGHNFYHSYVTLWFYLYFTSKDRPLLLERSGWQLFGSGFETSGALHWVCRPCVQGSRLEE